MDALDASRLTLLPTPTPDALGLEQARQAQLMAAIRAGQGMLPTGWAGHRVGLLAHQRHARAAAHRALGDVYPVLAQWLGEPAFDELAWWHWRLAPPRQGDLGTWGGELPQALAVRSGSRVTEQSTLARLEWAVHVAARAQDPSPGLPEGLEALQTFPPETLWLQAQPGLALLSCSPQVLARWRLAQARPGPLAVPPAGLAGEEGDWVLVMRTGWQVAVRVLPADQARFTRRLLAGDSLGQALTDAAPGNFQDWLREALAEGWWRAVSTASSCCRHDKDES